MNVVYDAGVFVAAERNDRRVWAEHRVRLESGIVPTTTAPVLAQVSRTPRQVQLRRMLRGCHAVPFRVEQAHEVGQLLNVARTADVMDGHLVLTAAALSPSTVLTSDPTDLRRLTGHQSAMVQIQPV